MKKTLAKVGTGLGILLTPALASAQQIPLAELVRALFPAQSGPVSVVDLFTRFLLILIVIAAILAIFYLIWAGIQYITASTDEEKAKKARTAIYNAIIGIVVIILSYVIIIWVSGLVREQIAPSGTGPNVVVPGGF